MDAIDQMLDLYNECVHVLSRLPEIPPDISEDMSLDVEAIEPERRVEELEWLKGHLAEVTSVMIDAQRVLAETRDLLGRRVPEKN